MHRSRYRQHEISNGINFDGEFRLGLFRRGDQHHLVLDDVREIELTQHQTQPRTQGNTADVNLDRLIGTDPDIFKSLCIKVNGESRIRPARIR